MALPNRMLDLEVLPDNNQTLAPSRILDLEDLPDNNQTMAPKIMLDLEVSQDHNPTLAVDIQLLAKGQMDNPAPMVAMEVVHLDPNKTLALVAIPIDGDLPIMDLEVNSKEEDQALVVDILAQAKEGVLIVDQTALSAHMAPHNRIMEAFNKTEDNLVREVMDIQALAKEEDLVGNPTAREVHMAPTRILDSEDSNGRMIHFSSDGPSLIIEV